METWGQFFRSNFDKILVFSFGVIMVLLILHLAHAGADAALLQWAKEKDNTITGAFLGMVTAGALARRTGPARDAGDPPAK